VAIDQATDVGQSAPARLVAAAHKMFMDRVTVEVVCALEDAGVRALVIKGPTIARWLYEEGDAPAYGDTDLLVSPSAVDRAEGVLQGLGFELRDGVALPGDRPWGARYWTRARDRAAVDLHRTCTGIEAPPTAAWEVLTQSTEGMTLRGTEVETLAEPARALLVALHAADHGPATPKPLHDLARAVRVVHANTWREVATLARELDATAALSAGLRMLPSGRKLADRLSLPLNRSVDAALRAGGGTRAALGIEWFASLPGLRNRLAWAARKLAPPPAYMRTCSRVARRGRGGLLLGYLWRPVHLSADVLVGLPSWRRARAEVRQRGGPPQG
jgi:hypothetical protein